MKSLRKSILTLLALTLFGGAGAWAQGPTVTELTNSIVPEAWYSQDNVNVTKAELEAWGFVEIDSATAAAWTGADPTVGINTNLYYGFTTDGKVKYIHFENGTIYPNQPEPDFITHYDLQSKVAYDDYTRIFITTGSGAIELTKSGANQWSLGQTPDYDLELQVEYYEAHALKNIPAGWTVKINGVPQQTPYQGDSLLITETDSVTLIPDGNPRRVKSVTLVDNSTPPAVYLEATTTAWADGINYAVPAEGLTYGDAVTVSGNVTLTLTEGTTLTLNKGISMASGATLTVTGPGTMAVNGTNNSTASTVAGTGTLVLTSGTLTAKGGNGQSLTITDMFPRHNTGASGGVAINGNVTVSGGTVTATGGNGGNLNTSAAGDESVMNNLGGNGGAAISGSVTVNAGGWTATNGSNGTYTSAGGDIECSAGTGGAAVAGTVTDNR